MCDLLLPLRSQIPDLSSLLRGPLATPLYPLALATAKAEIRSFVMRSIDNKGKEVGKKGSAISGRSKSGEMEARLAG